MNRSQLNLFYTENQILERVNEFINSITPGFNTPEDIVPSQIITREIDRLKGAFIKLEDFCKSRTYAKHSPGDFLITDQRTYEIIRLILALPTQIGFYNGFEITDKLPENPETLGKILDLLESVGFWEIICSSGNIENLVRVALISDYAKKRPYRVLQNIEKRVDGLVQKSVLEVSRNLNRKFEIASLREFLDKENIFSFNQPRSARRGIDYFVIEGDRPIAAITFIYLTAIGGSQLRDLRSLYPELQTQLSTLPAQLILIADGQGLTKIAPTILYDLFKVIPSVINIKQVEHGKLTEALIKAATEEVKRTTPLDRIIDSILMSGKEVSANDLPVIYDQARIALAQYTNQNSDLALTLSTGGKSIYWTRENLYKLGLELINKYEPRKALSIFTELLGIANFKLVESGQGDNTIDVIVSMEQDSVIPEELLVVSSDVEPNTDFCKHIARKSLQQVPEAKIAVLLVPNESPTSQIERRNIQSLLSANVVVIDPNTLIGIIKSKRNPRDEFLSLILEQSDLTKISPFVVNSATPRRMYFGRDREEAILLSTLSTNSIALLGSRRIGKTSLMHHATESLNNANFSAYFLDCQTVRNWSDFGEVAHRYWTIELPEDFRPQHLFDLITKLKTDSNENIVILLDEIDQLLEWDTRQEIEQVPEAFFRACRTISQNGEAQFVFSGERIIAKKLWDPHSPHWNFCRPLSLQQLDMDSTEKLLLQPLSALQIEINDIELFRNIIWAVTNGHPQIAQYLGDKLVQLLNLRIPSERSLLTVKDLSEIINSFDYKDHYLTTYWGQATSIERLISLLIVKGINTPSGIINELNSNEIHAIESDVIEALRMLELYGIVQQENKSYALRASWFEDALTAYGGLDTTISLYWGNLK